MNKSNEICPLANNEDNNKERYNPCNAKHAYVFQLHDTIRTLLPLAILNDSVAWNKHLDILQTQINSARNV